MDDYGVLSSGSGSAKDNSTLTCAASSLQDTNGLPFPTHMAIGVRVMQTLYGLLILFFGSLLNGLVIFLIVKYRKLRTVTFSIALQISLSDFIQTFVFAIPLIVNNAAGYWALGYILCIITGFLTQILVVLRSFLIFVFFMDIFFYVFTPFLYGKYSYRMALVICPLSWCSSVGLAILLLPGVLDCYMLTPALLCDMAPECNTCGIFLGIFVAVFYVPVSIIPVFLFVPLYLKGRKYRKQVQQKQPTKATSVLADEWKALKTFVYLFVAFILVSILPTSTIFIAKYLFGDIGFNLAAIASFNMWSFPVVWDGFVILRNKNIQEVLIKLKEKIMKYCRKNPATIGNVEARRRHE